MQRQMCDRGHSKALLRVTGPSVAALGSLCSSPPPVALMTQTSLAVATS